MDLCARSYRPFPAGWLPSPGPVQTLRVAPSETIRSQCRQLWCWAAVLEYLLRVYGAPSTQEGIASVVTCGDCRGGCGGTPPPRCDSPQILLSLLADRHLCAGWNAPGHSTAGWSSVPGEIRAGRPVAIRAPSGSFQAHFATISGWIDRGQGAEFFVEVMDPAGGMVRYLPLGGLQRSLLGWGKPSHLYFTRNPASPPAQPVAGRSPCPEGAVAADHHQTIIPIGLMEPLAHVGATVREIDLAPPDGWQEILERHLRFFLALGADAPGPLRGVSVSDLEVCGPIPMGRVEQRLQQQIEGLELEATQLFALRVGGKAIGFIELSEDHGNWRFEALSFAPSPNGDRFVEAVQQALAQISEAGRYLLLGFPPLHETALIDVPANVETWTAEMEGRAIPLKGFTFLPEVEFQPRRWKSYFGRLVQFQEDLESKVW